MFWQNLKSHQNHQVRKLSEIHENMRKIRIEFEITIAWNEILLLHENFLLFTIKT